MMQTFYRSRGPGRGRGSRGQGRPRRGERSNNAGSGRGRGPGPKLHEKHTPSSAPDRTKSGKFPVKFMNLINHKNCYKHWRTKRLVSGLGF